MYIFQPERHLLLKQIKAQAHLVTGDVLDVGAGNVVRYEHLFPSVRSYIKMDTVPSEHIDLVGSAESIPASEGSFDTIFCTQVLGDVFDVKKAVEECHRVLKQGGCIVFTESFMNESHDEPYDFWRFTKFSMEKLLLDAGFSDVEVNQRGGFFTVKAQYNIRYLIDRFHLYKHPFSRVLNPFFRIYSALMMWLDAKDTTSANRKYSLGWCAVARKPKSTQRPT